jgi:signal transduction histidine kinase
MPGRPGLHPRWRSAATRWLVLAAGLGLTVAATVFIALGSRGVDDARFNNAMQSATDRLVSRLDIYISTLRGGSALFAANDDIAVAAFARYAASLELQRWYPGIQGIGWSERVVTGLAGDVDEQHAIVHLEPMDERNRAAIGFDMYSEQTRRAAMRRARDSGEPAMSGRVTLVQEIIGPQLPGFLIYVPVYAGDGIPADPAARRQRLRGFVYAPFRAHDLFDGIFGTEAQPRVNFAVYDGSRVDSTALLYTSGAAYGHTPRRTATQQLEIAGHTWTVVFATRPEFDAASSRRLVPIFFLAGLLASLWLFRLASGQARARTAAEEANRAKSAFLATMSHELRTPLNAIGGYVDLIQLGVAGPVSQQQATYLDRVQRAQRHLLGLINDVLNFAKLDAGRVAFSVRPVRVLDAVTEAAAMMALQAEQRGIDFSVAGGPDVAVVADAEKLRQILLNLYSNAIKFTDPGGAVSTQWVQRGDAVEIEVTDTGVGIPEHLHEEIFEPFLQVSDDLTRQRQGTGLGLSISRELVHGMAGDIGVSSSPGAGSTFRVSLPGHADPAGA